MKRALFLFLGVSLAAFAAPEPGGTTLTLTKDWSIQSSAKAGATGDVISTPAFKPEGWIQTTVPSTVVNALVRNKALPDPYFGTNLRSFPGTEYKISTNFSNSEMPANSPYRVSWWYRTDFAVPADWNGKTLRLKFDGLNYRANVWLNGKRIADSTQVAGAWRVFEFDVTAGIKTGQTNSLAVEVFAPKSNDLAITFVDWNPQPPDKNMGLWRPVHLIATGPVSVSYPQAVTKLNLPAANTAELTVSAELHNATANPVEGTLKGLIGSIDFSQPVQLAANETRVVTFRPAEFPQLRFTNPKLWWPTQVGEQNLYPLDMTFEIPGQVSGTASIRFGIREIAAHIDEQGHLLYQINGKNILIRSAGYTFDMLLNSSPERQRAELEYVRDMNLNSVRLEGKLENDHFLDLTDEMGILVIAGWCCCDHWEHWDKWKAEDQPVSVASLKDQVRRLRSHASLATWMNGSDGPPPAPVEKAYLQVLKENNWPNPVVSSATQKPAAFSGPSGVKMLGPYEWVAPSYWLLDKKLGGAYGFNTETGPGPSVPPIESLRRMLPKEHLWPIDEFWTYHCGGGAFKDLHVFTEAMSKRYGEAKGVEDYAQKAQVLAYESHRAMFEAFGRNKYTSTGVVQWMLNNAWPSNIWHLYDWYMRPGGSYFGAKKANEPLHVQYSYDDQSVVVVNSFYRAYPALTVSAKVYNLDMTEKFSKKADVEAAPDSVSRAFTIPKLDGLSTTYFVRLSLEDAGKPVSSNLYWLSTTPEELDWEKSTWYHTPTKSFADMTALQSLPKVDLTYEAIPGERNTRVTISNPGKTIAFFVRLKVNRSTDGEEVLPVLWEDNYFSLFPGEKRVITATYRTSDLAGAQPVVEVDGWNVNKKSN